MYRSMVFTVCYAQPNHYYVYANNVLQQHYSLHVSEKPVWNVVLLPVVCNPVPERLPPCIVVTCNIIIIRNYYMYDLHFS